MVLAGLGLNPAGVLPFRTHALQSSFRTKGQTSTELLYNLDFDCKTMRTHNDTNDPQKTREVERSDAHPTLTISCLNCGVGGIGGSPSIYIYIYVQYIHVHIMYTYPHIALQLIRLIFQNWPFSNIKTFGFYRKFRWSVTDLSSGRRPRGAKKHPEPRCVWSPSGTLPPNQNASQKQADFSPRDLQKIFVN